MDLLRGRDGKAYVVGFSSEFRIYGLFGVWDSGFGA